MRNSRRGAKEDSGAFYMIDKSRSRKNGGAGLGLALTALILKRHDVTLAIESEEGKGTTMILNFPA